jgi:hypothetical protein
MNVIGSFTQGPRRSSASRVGTSLPSKSSSSSTDVSPRRCACTRTTRNSATRLGSARARTSPAGEGGELSLGRTKASPGWLRPGQLRASFLEHRAALRQQLGILSFPHRQVGAGVDDGDRAIANVRFQSTELRLRHSESDQHDAIGLLQKRLELFESQPRRGAILGTIFQQLTIVITYVARHVV